MHLPLVYHPDYQVPLGRKIRHPMSKYHHLRAALVNARLMPAEGGYLAPSPLGFDALAAVHDADYVARLLAAELTPQDERRLGLPNSEALSRRSCLAPAGTLLAARLALEHGLAANLAGGSHHAGPWGGSGYCVTNDVAIAARKLLDEKRIARILVIDCDVHQGDGTAAIFEHESRVFTFSMHAEKNFPARKMPSDLDVGLPDKTEDAAYLDALSTALERIGSAFQPELVFYNAGMDPVEWDRLGRLSLSRAGVRQRDRVVLEFASNAGWPLAVVLGGGYGTEPSEVASRHVITFEECARLITNSAV